LLDKDNPHVYAYTREGYGKKMLILLNFSTHFANTKTGFDISRAHLLLDNYPGPTAGDSLRPYEARVYELGTP
jgi:oligo-1,6-glucosidase